MPEWVDLCALSEKINWRVMPDEWEDRSAWWTRRLVLYLNAIQAARSERKPMTQEQLAPFVPSYNEAEAYLREQGMLP